MKKKAASNKKSEKKRPPEKSRKSIYWICLVLLVLLGLAGFLSYDLFLVKTITVEGNEVYSAEEIISATGIKTGEHMLNVNTDVIKRKLKTNPYIIIDSINFKLPDKVCIKIHERKRAAAIVSLDTAVIIDNTGYIMEIKALSAGNELMKIKGLNLTGYKINENILNNYEYQSQVLVDLIQAIEKQGMDQIETVDLTNLLNIKLNTKDGFSIFIGKSDSLEDKLQTAKQALSELGKMGKTGGTLDVSSVKSAVYSAAETPMPTGTPAVNTTKKPG